MFRYKAAHGRWWRVNEIKRWMPRSENISIAHRQCCDYTKEFLPPVADPICIKGGVSLARCRLAIKHITIIKIRLLYHRSFISVPKETVIYWNGELDQSLSVSLFTSFFFISFTVNELIFEQTSRYFAKKKAFLNPFSSIERSAFWFQVHLMLPRWSKIDKKQHAQGVPGTLACRDR